MNCSDNLEARKLVLDAITAMTQQMCILWCRSQYVYLCAQIKSQIYKLEHSGW